MYIETIIIGGGVIGLLCAKELLERFPHLEIALLEKSPYVGDMASGRNSGVLHAGIYYPGDSLKKYHCIQGNLLWRTLASELDLFLNPCGKYIFAKNNNEKKQLEELYQKAISNSVKGLRKINSQERDELSQFCFIEDGFFSETTAVISPSATCKSLGDWLYKKNLPMMMNHEVKAVNQTIDGIFKVETEKEVLSCKILINCAGAHAPKIRKMLKKENIEAKFIKGNYVKLKKDFYNKSLLYPIPEPGLVGLGVHTSFDSDGIVKFGPNVESCSGYDHNMREEVLSEMYEGVKSSFKGIKLDDLSLDYCGIRPRVEINGILQKDFLIGVPDSHGIKNYFDFLGIESPGLTAGPSLAKSMVNELVKKRILE